MHGRDAYSKGGRGSTATLKERHGHHSHPPPPRARLWLEFRVARHPGLTGGGDAYDQAHAEDAARFALVCAAEEQGNPASTDLIFEH
jgi:hypothetical protein